jgi:hypothetical protein
MDLDGGKQLGRNGAESRDQVRGFVPKSSAFASAILLFLLWMFVTWLLEGRTEVLRRPEAIGARLAYTVVANLMIGAVGAIWLIARLTRSQMLNPVQAGFGRWRSVLFGVIAGGALGGMFYAFVPNVPKPKFPRFGTDNRLRGQAKSIKLGFTLHGYSRRSSKARFCKGSISVIW